MTGNFLTNQYQQDNTIEIKVKQQHHQCLVYSYFTEETAM